MITLNLLPEIKREYLRTRRLEARVISLSILTIIVAIGLVVVAAIWVFAAQEVHKTLLTNNIKSNVQELKSVKDVDKYVTIQSQLANVDSLHDKKNIYSRLFDILPKLNPVAPNSIKLSGLEVDAATSTLTLEGVTDTFTGLETFRDTITNAKLKYSLADQDGAKKEEPLFSEVNVLTQSLSTDAQSQKTVVAFKLAVVYNSATFSKTSANVEISVPQIETTQSKQGAPDVFGGTQ